MDFYDLDGKDLRVEILPDSSDTTSSPGRILFSLKDNTYFFGTQLGWKAFKTGKRGGVGTLGGSGRMGRTGEMGPCIQTGSTGGTGRGSYNQGHPNIYDFAVKPTIIKNYLNTPRIVIEIYSLDGSFVPLKTSYLKELNSEYISIELPEELHLKYNNFHFTILLYNIETYINTKYINKYRKIINTDNYQEIYRIPLEDYNINKLIYEISNCDLFSSDDFNCSKLTVPFFVNYVGELFTSDLILGVSSNNIDGSDNCDCTSFSINLAKPEVGFVFLKCLEYWNQPVDGYSPQNVPQPIYPSFSSISLCKEGHTWHVTHGYGSRPGSLYNGDLNDTTSLVVEVFDEEGLAIPIFPWNGKQPFKCFFYEQNQHLLPPFAYDPKQDPTYKDPINLDDGQFINKDYTLNQYIFLKEGPIGFGCTGGLGRIVAYSKQENIEPIEIISSKIINFGDIFNNWERFSLPYNSIEENNWILDSVNNKIICTVNSSSLIGFVSDYKFEKYTHEATLSSTNSDDDYIALVIAYVPSNESTDGFEHILLAGRHCGGLVNNPKQWSIWYKNNNSVSNSIIVAVLNDESGILSPRLPTNTGPGWAAYPNGIKINVDRNYNIITCTTSDFENNPDNLLLSSTLTIDLNDYAYLNEFKDKKCRVGYACYSQNASTFSDVNLSGVANVTTCVKPIIKWPGEYSTIGYDYKIIDKNNIEIHLFKCHGTFPVRSYTKGRVKVSYNGLTYPLDPETYEQYDPNKYPLMESKPCRVVYNQFDPLFIKELLYVHYQNPNILGLNVGNCYNESITGSTHWNIKHNLNLQSQNLELKIYLLSPDFDDTKPESDSNVKYIENSVLETVIKHHSLNQVSVFFNAPASGKVEIYLNPYVGIEPRVLYDIDNYENNLKSKQNQLNCTWPLVYKHKQKIPKSTWRIDHNLNTKNISVQAYDKNGIMIGPDQLRIWDENTIYLDFYKFTNIFGNYISKTHEWSFDLSTIDFNYFNNSYDKMTRSYYINNKAFICPSNIGIIYFQQKLQNIGDPIRDPILGYETPEGWEIGSFCYDKNKNHRDRLDNWILDGAYYRNDELINQIVLNPIVPIDPLLVHGVFLYKGILGTPSYIGYTGLPGSIPIAILSDEAILDNYNGNIGMPSILIRPNRLEYWYDLNQPPFIINVRTIGDPNGSIPLSEYNNYKDEPDTLRWGIPPDVDKIEYLLKNNLPEYIPLPLLPNPPYPQEAIQSNNVIDTNTDINAHIDEPGWVYYEEECLAPDTPPGCGWALLHNDLSPKSAVIFILGDEILHSYDDELNPITVPGPRYWAKKFIEDYLGPNDLIFLDIYDRFTLSDYELTSPFDNINNKELNKLNYNSMMDFYNSEEIDNYPEEKALIEYRLNNNPNICDENKPPNYQLRLYWAIVEMYHLSNSDIGYDIANKHIIVIGEKFINDDVSCELSDDVPIDYDLRTTRFAISEYAKQANVKIHFMRCGYDDELETNNTLDNGEFINWVTAESGGSDLISTHDSSVVPYSETKYTEAIKNLGSIIKNNIPGSYYERTGGFGRAAYWEFTGGTGSLQGQEPWNWDWYDTTSLVWREDTTSWVDHYWIYNGEHFGEPNIIEYHPDKDEFKQYYQISGIGDRQSYIFPIGYCDNTRTIGEFFIDKEKIKNDGWAILPRKVDGKAIVTSHDQLPFEIPEQTQIYYQLSHNVFVWNILHNWGDIEPLIRIYTPDTYTLINPLTYTIKYKYNSLEIWFTTLTKGIAILEKPPIYNDTQIEVKPTPCEEINTDHPYRNHKENVIYYKDQYGRQFARFITNYNTLSVKWRVIHRWGYITPKIYVESAGYEEVNYPDFSGSFREYIRYTAPSDYTVEYFCNYIEIEFETARQGIVILEHPEQDNIINNHNFVNDKRFSMTGGTGGCGKLKYSPDGSYYEYTRYRTFKGGRGALGSEGKRGPQGSKGCSGGTGSEGKTGECGATGGTGNTGQIGQTGHTGRYGDRGPTGGSGGPADVLITGLSGGTGGAGPFGGSGGIGSSGISGSIGGPGPTGGTGKRYSGQTGSSGGTGQTGSRGNVGPQGKTGGAGGSVWNDHFTILTNENVYLRRFLIRISSKYLKHIYKPFTYVDDNRINNFTFTVTPSYLSGHFETIPDEVFQQILSTEDQVLYETSNLTLPYNISILDYSLNTTYLFEGGAGLYNGPIYIGQYEDYIILNLPRTKAVMVHKQMVTDGYDDPRSTGPIGYELIQPKWDVTDYGYIKCIFQHINTFPYSLKSGEILPWVWYGEYTKSLVIPYNYYFNGEMNPVRFHITIKTDGYIQGVLHTDLLAVIETPNIDDIPQFQPF